MYFPSQIKNDLLFMLQQQDHNRSNNTMFLQTLELMSNMPRYYDNYKQNVNIKMIFLYHKLCNKQDKLFSSSRSYLHKGQGLPNEF